MMKSSPTFLKSISRLLLPRTFEIIKGNALQKYFFVLRATVKFGGVAQLAEPRNHRIKSNPSADTCGLN